MIRTLRDEVERYGPYSLAVESQYDHPMLWGSKRTGPDLARVGGKYSDDWHVAHLYNPRDLVPQSVMPAYRWLLRNELDVVNPDGSRDSLSVDVANPTSLALGPDGTIYVSSRFEGQVFRLTDDRAELYATDLGVATGLACAADGTLFVGDRTGTILRITAGGPGESERHVESYATSPGSVAAFHLAMGPDGCLYVTGPTLASHDVVYRITPDREVQIVCRGFGRPQGLAFDAAGALFETDALAGSAGLYRVDTRSASPEPELVVAAPHLVGVAFNPQGGMLLASHDTVWRL
jgi:sugar lactone lactonase YvrE